MGNKEGKSTPLPTTIEEEEWEKEATDSSPETMTIIARKWEELPPKVKEKIEKIGVTESELKENLQVVFSVCYFNYRKDFNDLPVNEKKGKCSQCSKQNMLKASMSC
jgi:hypothetical protein